MNPELCNAVSCCCCKGCLQILAWSFHKLKKKNKNKKQLKT